MAVRRAISKLTAELIEIRRRFEKLETLHEDARLVVASRMATLENRADRRTTWRVDELEEFERLEDLKIDMETSLDNCRADFNWMQDEIRKREVAAQ
ncbi:MAG TPA: hypothetical protein VGM43_14505 [Bryobacteraceae bacterium]